MNHKQSFNVNCSKPQNGFFDQIIWQRFFNIIYQKYFSLFFIVLSSISRFPSCIGQRATQSLLHGAILIRWCVRDSQLLLQAIWAIRYYWGHWGESFAIRNSQFLFADVYAIRNSHYKRYGRFAIIGVTEVSLSQIANRDFYSLMCTRFATPTTSDTGDSLL